MIVYRCNRCGHTVSDRMLVTLKDAAAGEQHFCSIECVVAWAQWAGYYKPPADGVVDAEVMCGAQSDTGSDCRFTVDHPGDHVSFRGETWADNHALIWHLQQAVKTAFASSDGTDIDEDNAVHYRGKAVGLQTAIDIVEGRHV